MTRRSSSSRWSTTWAPSSAWPCAARITSARSRTISSATSSRASASRWNSTYFARLILKQENELGSKLVELDARPSDCLAIAAAQKKPIFVTTKLFQSVEDMTEVLTRIGEEKQTGEGDEPEQT
jgi:hypothetical protein